MWKHLVIVIALLVSTCLASSAFAADYHFCDTGDDITGDGTSGTPWKTWEKALNTFNTFSPGDNALLCYGGDFDSSPTQPKVIATCTSVSPCKISAYEPPGMPVEDTGVKPIIHSADTTHVINLDTGIDYFTLEKIHILGDNDTALMNTTAIKLGFLSKNVIIDNVRVENMRIGVITSVGDALTYKENVTIQNSEFVKIWSVAAHGASFNYKIINNLFDRVGRNSTGRPIYLNGPLNEPGMVQNILVAGNTFTNSSPSDIGNGDYTGSNWAYGDFGCNSTIVGGHGDMTNIIIRNNLIVEARNTARGGCWAISIDNGYAGEERFVNMLIENNRLYNVGGVGVGCSNCGNVTIRNNKIYLKDGVGVAAPVRPEDAAYPTNNVTMENNLVIFENQGIAEGIGASTGVFLEIDSGTAVDNVVIYSQFGASNRCYSVNAAVTLTDNECWDAETGGLGVNTTINIE